MCGRHGRAGWRSWAGRATHGCCRRGVPARFPHAKRAVGVDQPDRREMPKIASEDGPSFTVLRVEAETDAVSPVTSLRVMNSTNGRIEAVAKHRGDAVAVCALGMAANEWWAVTRGED